MFQSIPQTPLRDRPKVSHRGQIIQQKKIDTPTRIDSRLISNVLSLLKYNPHWYEKYNIDPPQKPVSIFPSSVFSSLNITDDEGNLIFPQPIELPQPADFMQSEPSTLREVRLKTSFTPKTFRVLPSDGTPGGEQFIYVLSIFSLYMPAIFKMVHFVQMYCPTPQAQPNEFQEGSEIIGFGYSFQYALFDSTNFTEDLPLTVPTFEYNTTYVVFSPEIVPFDRPYHIGFLYGHKYFTVKDSFLGFPASGIYAPDISIYLSKDDASYQLAIPHSSISYTLDQFLFHDRDAND